MLSISHSIGPINSTGKVEVIYISINICRGNSSDYIVSDIMKSLGIISLANVYSSFYGCLTVEEEISLEHFKYILLVLSILKNDSGYFSAARDCV
jgi:hypothetical protein